MDKLPPPDRLDFKSANLANDWRKFEETFLNYYHAAELAGKSKETQVAILLHLAGPESLEIKKSFVFSGSGDDTRDNYKAYLKKLREYCVGKTNVVYERFKFWQRKGGSREH